MKICFFHTALGDGGAERVMMTLTRKWVDFGHQVAIFYLTGTSGEKSEGLDFSYGGKIKRIPLDGLPPGRIRYRLALRAAFQREMPDVIVCFNDGITQLAASILRPFSKYRLIASERGNPDSYDRSLLLHIKRKWYYHWVDRMVFQSERAMAAGLRRYGVAPKNARVIPNPLRMPDASRSAPELPPKTILCIGRLTYAKGFERMIKAFAVLAERYPDWSLYIYGDGELRGDLERLRDELHLAGRVFLPGAARDVFGLYRQAEIFVLSSYFEGLPNTLMEALSAGCACVAFDCRFGPSELIRHRVNGLLVPAENITALAEAIAELIDDEPLRKQLRRAAPLGMEGYEEESICRRWESLFREVTAAAGAAEAPPREADPRPVLLFDVAKLLEYGENSGKIIAGIERVCLEEFRALQHSGAFQLKLFSSRGHEQYLPALRRNLPEFQNTEFIPMPRPHIAVRVVRAVLTGILKLGCRMEFAATGKISRRSVKNILTLWQWGAPRWRRLEQFPGQNILSYSCFYAPPAAMNKLGRIKKLGMIHDLIPLLERGDDFGRYFGYWTEFSAIAKYSDALCMMSECTARDFKHIFPDSPLPCIITYGAADPHFAPQPPESVAAIKKKYGIPADSTYFIAISAYGKRKNLPLTLRAFLAFARQNSSGSCRLVLCGNGAEQEEEVLKLAASSPGTILPIGFVDDCDLPALYSGAEALLYLSDYEGFGLPVLEAMQSGTAVICARKASLPEVGGAAAYYVDNTNIDAIVQAMRDIVGDTQRRRELRSAGLRRAAAFSWAGHHAKILAALQAWSVHPAAREP